MSDAPPSWTDAFEAWVEFIDGDQPLNEYKIRSIPPTATRSAAGECFVECVEGKEFRVKIKIDWSKLTTHDISARFACDGRQVDNWAMLRKNRDEYIIFDSAYRPDGDINIRHPLAFNEAVTTDNRQACSTYDPASGSLVVTLKQVQYVHVGRGQPQLPKLEKVVLFEEDHKLGSIVSVGESAVECEDSELYVPKSDGNGERYRFIFKYRTRAKLQLMKIIPEDVDNGLMVNVADDEASDAGAESQRASSEDGTALSGQKEKQRGVIALQSAYKRIRALEGDNWRLRNRTHHQSEEEAVDLTDMDDD